MSKTWEVTIPIAGHALVEVEAETEAEAIEAAFADVERRHFEEWEALEQFNQGNVCYCPHPWTVEAVCIGDGE